jgi:hypothetical protein
VDLPTVLTPPVPPPAFPDPVGLSRSSTGNDVFGSSNSNQMSSKSGFLSAQRVSSAAFGLRPSPQENLSVPTKNIRQPVSGTKGTFVEVNVAESNRSFAEAHKNTFLDPLRRLFSPSTKAKADSKGEG